MDSGARELAAFLLLGVTYWSRADDQALNRSFYVPVELEVCDHLADAVLYRSDRPLRSLPGTHVFQFTFFPALGRIEPELDRVRVEGNHEGEPFRTEVIVTPATVYAGNKKVDLDLDSQMTRLRRHVDARHETVALKLRCSSACGRRTASGSR